jgi:hypothetical protein
VFCSHRAPGFAAQLSLLSLLQTQALDSKNNSRSACNKFKSGPMLSANQGKFFRLTERGGAPAVNLFLKLSHKVRNTSLISRIQRSQIARHILAVNLLTDPLKEEPIFAVIELTSLLRGLSAHKYARKRKRAYSRDSSAHKSAQCRPD